MALEVGELRAKLTLDASSLNSGADKATAAMAKTSKAIDEANESARAAEREINRALGSGGSAASIFSGKLHSVGNAFSEIKRDADVFGGAAGAAFANAADDAVSMVMAFGSGGVLGAVSLVTTAVGVLVTAFSALRSAEEEAAKAAIKAEEDHQKEIENTISKVREKHKQITDDMILEQNVRINALQAEIDEQQGLVGRLGYYKQGLLPGGAVDPNSSADERMEAMKRLHSESVSLAENRAKLEELLNERNRALEIMGRREAAQETLDIQKERLAQERDAQRDNGKDINDWWSSRGGGNAAPISMGTASLMFGNAIAPVVKAMADKELAARTEIFNLRVKGFQLEKAQAETVASMLGDVAGVTQEWASAARSLFSGGSVNAGALVGGTAQKGLGALAQAGGGAFDLAIINVTDELDKLGNGITEAAAPIISGVMGVASAVAKLPSGILGIAGSAAGALASAAQDMAENVASAWKGVANDLLSSVRGMVEAGGSIFQSTVGVMVSKTFGGLDKAGAMQSMGGVLGGFGAMGGSALGVGGAAAGALTLASAANPIATAVFAPLVMAATPAVVALGALGGAALVATAGLTALGMGVFTLSTQSKGFERFQRAMSTIGQTIADKFSPIWDRMLPFAAALNVVVGGMSNLASVLMPNVHIYKGIFDAAKLVGMSMLTLNIGFLDLQKAALWTAVWFNRITGQSNDEMSRSLNQNAQDRQAALAARGELENLTWGSAMAAGALLGAADAANAATGAMLNVPDAFKVSNAWWAAQDAMGNGGGGGGGPQFADNSNPDAGHSAAGPGRSHGSGGGGGGGGGSGGGSSGGSGNTVNIYVNNGDPQSIADLVVRVLEQRSYEKGTSPMLTHATPLGAGRSY